MKKKNNIVRYFFLIIVIILTLNLLLYLTKKVEERTESPKKKEKQEENFVSLKNATLVRMKLPAIDNNGKGVSTYLIVEAVPGSGRTLVDIENLLFWADTQQSIRIARSVASKYTNNSVKDYDLIYGIEANASLVGGPSAGAALTIATIFALNNEPFREDVMITGTINHDGTIGPVSSILEKAKASKEINATIFLVPLLQSRDITYETSEYCEKFGLNKICWSETIPKKINVSEKAGISVIEVFSIDEALKYFRV